MKNLEPISRKFKTSSGMEIAVDLWGPPSEKSVLLLHGGGQTRHSWVSTAKRLVSVGAHAVTLDLRGHGNSNWSRESEYELGHFSQDIAVILEKLRLRPALVGASLGGLVGMFLEGRLRPNSVSSLVLVDIVPNMNVGGAERVKDFMLKHAKTGFSSLEEVADVLSKYNPYRKNSNDLEGLKKNLRKRGERWFWHWDPSFISSERDQKNPDMRNPKLLNDVMGEIDIPVLLVRGKMSDLVTEVEAQQFLQMYPKASFVDVSGAGHMVAGDKNDVFTDQVIKFLNQVWA